MLLVAALAFLPFVWSPPHLMDDVDAVQAQIARTMLESGDWVTPRLDGIAYLEKSPLIYWIMGVSFGLFGVSDWAARLPLELINVAFCWATFRFGRWAFGAQTGAVAGLALATCVGMFLFTRILIPDAALSMVLLLVLWAYLRLTDPAPEERPWLWAAVLYASLACGVLLKGLIAVVFPACTIAIHLVWSGPGRVSRLRGLHLIPGTAFFLLLAAPWHILAAIRNPPLFAWNLESHAGQYHGFFWFYFFNEHLLRFLNRRYPRDYNTVPRLWFWLLHFAWLFPWSVYLPAAARLNFRAQTRAGRARLLLAVWTAFILLFFTFSTTQEYYSLPVYPALCLLLACAIMAEDRPARVQGWILAGLFGAGAAVSIALLLATAKVPAPGDISAALHQHPEMYTLSLGHMGDLTLKAFAYLRWPLAVAAAAMLLGAAGMAAARSRWLACAVLSAAMIVFLQGARLALIAFDPYLGSKPLADALMRAPRGVLVEADAYYAFSSVFFYTDRQALLWRGRRDNLEYGSNAPHAAQVFLDDPGLKRLWSGPSRVYLLAGQEDLPELQTVLGQRPVILAQSGDHCLLVSR